MPVPQHLMQGHQRLMQGRQRHMLLHRPQQQRRRLATMGTALQLLVYTLPKHLHHTRPRRQGPLEPQHPEPTVHPHHLLAKPLPRTTNTTDLGGRSMHSVRSIGSAR